VLAIVYILCWHHCLHRPVNLNSGALPRGFWLPGAGKIADRAAARVLHRPATPPCLFLLRASAASRRSNPACAGTRRRLARRSAAAPRNCRGSAWRAPRASRSRTGQRGFLHQSARGLEPRRDRDLPRSRAHAERARECRRLRQAGCHSGFRGRRRWGNGPPPGRELWRKVGRPAQ
jgi:hypothetical protein